ncbi:hypothetical protein C0Q70_06854 [Pomacea canaliculata]|uniref:Uncharacterized protein n=1 Tax=Pomacea canaliculata TaxID=400727 RepID=A0A2T7PDE8_POMCA|nr:hypothetical protein C0Q70_06854 [Pomacea canaliculata]
MLKGGVAVKIKGPELGKVLGGGKEERLEIMTSVVLLFVNRYHMPKNMWFVGFVGDRRGSLMLDD